MNLYDRIFFGDNVSILETFPEDCIDLVITSPPYDSLRLYNGCDQFDLESLIYHLYRVLKEGGVIVWVVGDQIKDGNRTLTSFRQALAFQEAGFNVHDVMIYQKQNETHPESTRYAQVWEFMFIFSKGKPKTIHLIKDKKNVEGGSTRKPGKIRKKDGTFRNSNKLITIAEYGLRPNIWKYVTGLWNSTKDQFAFQHPAIFPEKLVEDHLLTWSDEGDLVLDPFLGSGTTAKMAHILKRKYVGIEKNLDYADIIKERIKIAENIRKNEDMNLIHFIKKEEK